jgi:hypothetical protein
MSDGSLAFRYRKVWKEFGDQVVQVHQDMGKAKVDGESAQALLLEMFELPYYPENSRRLRENCATAR